MMFDDEKENGEAEEPETDAAAEAGDDAEAKAEEPEAQPDADSDSDAQASAETVESQDAEPEAKEPAAPARPTRKKRTPEEKVARRARRKQRRIDARPAKRKPIVRLAKPEKVRAARKERVGVVVSDAMNRTITVKVERAYPHQRYGKVIRRSSTFPVHDAENTASVGDRVRIVETRPISKTKRWRLAEVLETAR